MFLRILIFCLLLGEGILANAQSRSMNYAAVATHANELNRTKQLERTLPADTAIKPKVISGKQPPKGVNQPKASVEDSEFAIKHPTYKINLKKPAGGLGANGKPLHSSRKAWILSTVLPGTGQIYNHRYWKLPIIYGGLAAVIYGVSFNQKNYNQNLQYYKVLLINPAAPSLPSDVRLAGVTQIESIKNYYRRNRDLFIIGGVALLLANSVDAYVDSELKGFDVSNKLTLQIKPLLGSPYQPIQGMNRGVYGLKLTMRLKPSY